MATTVTATIRAENQEDADNAQSELEVIIKNEGYSETEKCTQFISLAASINDAGYTSAKVEYKLERDNDLKISFNGTLNHKRSWGVGVELSWQW